MPLGITAIRTDCMTGEEREVDLIIARLYHDEPLNSWWIEIISGGVTGYEGMREDHIGVAIERGGWLACMGTSDLWDKLFIPADQMRKIADWVEKEKEEGKDKV